MMKSHIRRRWTIALTAAALSLATLQLAMAAIGMQPNIVIYYIRGLISYETIIKRHLYEGTAPTPTQLQDAAFFYSIGNPTLTIEESTTKLRTVQPAAATAIAGYTFNSTHPVLPFFGNTLIEGFALSPSGTQISATGFFRQPDCSLTQAIFEPVANLLDPTSVQLLDNVQTHLHQLAGITTTANVFAAGCADSPLGRRSINTGQPLVGTPGYSFFVDLNPSTDKLEATVSNDTTGASSVLTLSAGAAFSFVVADVSGDGLPDIVASGVNDPGTSQPAFAVYRNAGNGTFSAASYFDSVATWFLLDDVTGDGKVDIVGQVPAGGVVTLPGNGNGTFGAATASLASVATGSRAFVSGDFNNDNKKDVLLGARVLLGAGDGTFTAGPALASGLQNEVYFSNAAVGDLDKDGKLDIAYSSNVATGSLQILLGNGDGSFHAGPRYASLTPGQEVAITEIDGDGNLDIVVGNSSQGAFVQDTGDGLLPMFQILLNRGDGSFAGAPAYSLPTFQYNVQSAAPQFVTGQFTADTVPDALVYTANSNLSSPSSLSVLPGDVAGRFGTAISSPINLAPSMIAVADISRDGKPDAVLAGTSITGAAPRLSVLINQGNGTFAAEQDYALANPAIAIATGDFNGDGFADVAVAVAPALGSTGTSGVYVLPGQSNGTLGAAVKMDSSLNPESLAAADLNGDGRADLVVADFGFSPGGAHQVNGALHVYLGKADGTFTTAATPTSTATNYTAVALGDLNGDGKADLIAGGYVAGTSIGNGKPYLYSLLGKGDGTFGTTLATALSGTDGIGAQSLITADFNADGKLDVALGNPNDFTELLLGAGDGRFGHALLALGQQPDALGSADLTGDGSPELLVGGPGGLAVFKNLTAWPALAATPAFAVSARASSGSVVRGASATTTITVTPSGGFSGNVTLTCSGLPTGAACNFSPASLSVTNAAVTSTVTMTTTAATAANAFGAPGRGLDPFLPTGTVLAGTLVPCVRRRRSGARSTWRTALAWLALPMLVATALVGCGGGSGGGNTPVGGTPAGTYTVVITATSGSVSHTVNYALTVT